MTLSFCLTIFCVLGSIHAVLFAADVCDLKDQQTRDLSCACGRRKMQAVVCDDARAATITQQLNHLCPWCLNQGRAGEPRTSVRADYRTMEDPHA